MLDPTAAYIIEYGKSKEERLEWMKELMNIRSEPETYAHPFDEELCLKDICEDL